MYGWRGRIGKISPSRSDTFTYEFYKIVPEGVVLVLSGFTIFHLVRDDIERAYLQIEESAKDLAKVGVDFIIAGGTPIFTLKGKDSDQEAIRRIKQLTNIDATTSVTAEMAALAKLSIKKIAIATPFKEERNSRLQEFLTNAGYSVANILGLGIEVNADFAKVPAFEVYRLAKRAFLQDPTADGLFLPCARWPTIEIIEKLEQDLGIPVFSSTTATIWKALDELKIKEPIKRYGRLLEME